MKRALTAAGILLMACTEQGPSGRFVLAQIDGAPLPWVYPLQNVRYDSGILTLKDDGTFTDIIAWADGDGRHTTDEFGTWTQDGTRLRLEYSVGGTNCPFHTGPCSAGLFEAKLQMGLLTKVRNEGAQLVYRRE